MADKSLTIERFPPELRRHLRLLAAELSTDEQPVTMRSLIIRGCDMVVSAAGAEARQARLTRSGRLPCGCLDNEAGAHRVGCPDHPEGVRGS